MTLTTATTTATPWLNEAALARRDEILSGLNLSDTAGTDARLHQLVELNRQTHAAHCINLNPASNIMNPRAEAMLAAGLSSRASLGHPGDKYEMGLEAIEEIEIIAAAATRELFNAQFAEIRVSSGALANLYAFMATCQPGDSIIVPPPSIGGHVTHQSAGAAGLYGLDIHECPADPETFSVDLDALATLAERVRPKLITIGTSLNLRPHPMTQIGTIARDVGAYVLFDAAHACGMIAGGVWPNPLNAGADIMTMSTYKSLGGPAGGLVVTNDAALAERIDAIAYPGLTANFDVGKTAALAITLLDWLELGADYATAMRDNGVELAAQLSERGLDVYQTKSGPTESHQLALDASHWGGGHAAAQHLRRCNLLASAIGLPGLPPGGGLRLGTPEITRFGMKPAAMAELAELIVNGLGDDPAAFAPITTELRNRYPHIEYVRS